MKERTAKKFGGAETMLNKLFIWADVLDGNNRNEIYICGLEVCSEKTACPAVFFAARQSSSLKLLINRFK